MGFKVNIFLVYCLFHGVAFTSFNMVALFAILYGFTLLYKNFKVWKFTGKFPGKNFTPNFKNLFEYSAESFHRELTDLWKKHGQDKFVTWIGFERFIVASKLRDVQAILSVTDDAVLMENYQQVWPWIGGDAVKASEFSPTAILKAFNNGPFKSEAFVKSLNKRIFEVVRQQNIGTRDVIDVQPMIRKVIFGIIYEVAMGSEPTNCEEIFAASEKLIQLADQRVFSGLKQNKLLRNVLGEESKMENYKNTLKECVKKVLDEKRAAANCGYSGDSHCLLDMFVANESLNYEEISASLETFIVLGYDRLSAAACFALAELSQQEYVQEVIQREVERPMDSLQALKSMTTLGRFLLESHRLHPSIISKYVTTGIPLNGFFVPPETSVLLFLFGTGRDPQRFESPEAFDMNRSNLSENFGQEMDVPMTMTACLVGNLVRNYQFTKEKNDELELGVGVTLRPKSVRLRVKVRK